LEKRERAIILVEEDMSKRKKSLEEDYVNQTSNAQVVFIPIIFTLIILCMMHKNIYNDWNL
jgi:hypothetical protein